MPRPLAALRRDRVVQAVLGLVVLAVGARLVGLGARVAHQDEARVGYWTLRFLASGQYEYRPIVHGPFIHIVDRHLFALFGPSDFVARLPMALLGGVLPAAALLFRSRLRDAETVALAALFAANPVLLYYSRFMRQDLPLAVLATFALGFAVRAVDSTGRRRRYNVYVAGLALGLAATTKENVLLYPVAWAGALALVLDQRLIAADDAVRTAREFVPDAPRPAVALPAGVRRVGVLLFLATTPVVAAVAELDGNLLGVLVLASGLAYYGAVRGGTVWHLLGGLPLSAVGVLALARPAFNPRLTTFVAGVLWLLAALLLADERLFRYDPRVATDGGSTDDDTDSADTDDGAQETAEPAGDAGVADAPDAAGPATGADAGPDPGGDERGVGSLRDRLLPLPPLGVAYLLALAVVVLFYAPRGGGYPAIGPDIEGWGLWSALAAGSLDGLATVVRQATFGTWTDFLGRWAGDAQDHAYLPFFLDFLNTLREGALTLSLAAVGGTLYERYVGDAREFVAFCAYWGFASVLGYPLVTDIAAPWATVHAIVALAIPAAVAIAAVYRVGRAELVTSDTGAGSNAGVRVPDPDWLAVAAVAVVLLGAGLQVGAAAADGVYQNPQSTDNELVQYAQSSSTDLKPVIADVRSVAGQNDGVDVLWYGDEFDAPNESEHDQPPAGPGWFERLPLAYYTEMEAVESGEDVVVNSTTDPEDVRASDAPVVVSFADGEDASITDPHTDIESFLGGYDRYRGQRFLFDTGVRSSLLYFVDTSGLDDPAGTYENATSELVGPHPAVTGSNGESRAPRCCR